VGLGGVGLGGVGDGGVGVGVGGAAHCALSGQHPVTRVVWQPVTAWAKAGS
jgi:hypothetical protein